MGTLGIHGAPLAAAAIVAVVAGLFHHHGWLPRVTSWLFGIVAMLVTIGITTWLDALAGLTATGTGLTVLIALVIICVALVLKHTSDKKKHHPVWSSAIFVVAGVVIVVTVGSFRLIMKNAGQSLKGSGQSLGQAITQINSGQAAHAVQASHRIGILTWGVVIFVALVIFARIRHGKSKKPASAPAAITSGRATGRPAGRPTASTGRRR